MALAVRLRGEEVAVEVALVGRAACRPNTAAVASADSGAAARDCTLDKWYQVSR